MIPYCLVIWLEGKYKCFYGIDCINNFLSFIFKKDIIIYCHNLTFDGGIILSSIDETITIKNSIFLWGNIYSFTLYKNGKNIMFKCSSKFLPLKLKDIGKLINENKLDFDYNVVNHNNYMNEDIIKKTIEYCQQDVNITKKFMTIIFENFREYEKNFHTKCFSISKLSISVFLHIYPKNKIFADTEEDSILRYGNYGGRCEVFGNLRQGEKLYHFDFSGMYANRLSEEYPVGKGKLVKNIDFKNQPGIYCVHVISNMYIPILPLRLDKLYFPNGEFETVTSHHELKLFIENGGIIKNIKWGYVYEKEERIYKNFAEFCIRKRKEGKELGLVWKLLVNSFIGRMGMNNSHTKTIIMKEADLNSLKMTVLSAKIINKIAIAEIICINKEKSKGNVIIPLITTSKARVMWWRLANKVMNSGGRILYCDTDSIYMAHKEKISFFCGEYWESLKDGVFVSSKSYMYLKNNNEEITKIKGISNKGEIRFETFKKNFYENKNIETGIKFWSKKNLKISIHDLRKETNLSNYDKRIFNKDKTDSTAIVKVYPNI